jgi:cyclophilin family peptidyl-prolyl cis-trans isomerase/protein-disulfide isomerase
MERHVKQIAALLILLLLLAACAPTTGGNGEAADNQQQPTAAPEEAASDDGQQTADGAGDVTIAPDATEMPAADDSAAAEVGDPAVVRADDWVKGAEDPAVTIIEYADFQCPGCGGFYPILKQLADAHPDDVRVVYRHFPLNQIHPNAQKAAEAAEAAGAQDQFWAYHDLLFERQGEWSALDATAARDFFVALAEELGLDAEQFATELDGGMHAERVSASEQEAIGLGLPGTPSAIVNGQILPGEALPRDIESWEAFVSEESKLKELAARQYPAAPEMTIDPEKSYTARVEMASGGAFTIELLPKSAPQTVNSFVFLARNGWFDGVTFHRVLPGFVAQTGDPSGTGRGGPGYMIPNEIDPNLSHDAPGMVAMANAGPNTNGSQWYITYGDVSQLDGSYTIFGRVTEGMDVVEAITPRDPSRNPGAPPGDVIRSITIEEN